MKKHKKLLTPTRVVRLANRLSHIPEVAQFDMPGEPQGDTLAHALSHWEDSFAAILDELLPKLVKEEAASAEQTNDILHDLGDQLRHILYHIRDTKYFRYLLDDEA
jgi:hypothetical protein